MRTCPECDREFQDNVLKCPEDGEDTIIIIAADAKDDLIGKTIGSYQILRTLGKGGMGAVYEAVHPVIHTRVAIKFLHKEAARKPRVVERFYNEARSVNLIGHDNLVRILDMNKTEDGRHYIIMEYLRGKPLAALMKGRVLPLGEAGPIVLQVCDALHAAHSKGIVHRDLKPDNIFLTVHNHRRNFTKVVDFGIARLGAGGAGDKTKTGTVLGTASYMSPEQAKGTTSGLDGRSDIYSLGIIMYQMFSGRVPFKGESFTETLVKHVLEAPKPPSEIAEVSPALEKVILKTLEKDPAARYQTMGELAQALMEVMKAEGATFELPAATAEDEEAAGNAVAGVALTPSSPGYSPGAGTPLPGATKHLPGSRKFAWIAAALGGAVILVGGAAAALIMRGGQTPAEARPAEGAPAAAAPSVPAAASATAAVPAAIAAGVTPTAAPVAPALALAPTPPATAGAPAVAPTSTPQQAATDPGPPAAAPAAPTTVSLSVVSVPLGAAVVAEWEGGRAEATSPAQLDVPASKKVSLRLKLAGHEDASREIVADSSQMVMVALQPVAAAAPPKAPAPAKKKAAAQKKANVDNDAAEEIEF